MPVQGDMMRLCPPSGPADVPAQDGSEAARGPIMPPRPETATLTIRLDHTMLAWFHRQVHAPGGGDDYPLINDALRNDIAEEDQRDLRSAAVPHTGGIGRPIARQKETS